MIKSRTDINEANDKLAFVFELVRHGARPPSSSLYDEFFPVSEGQLTPEGMRQRYLLGRYHRERYVEKFKLLSEDYHPEELYIQSTNWNRTMQSGYSEMMGLYPPRSGAPEMTERMVKSFEDGTALPPFKVRDAKKVNSQLGFAALPDSFSAVDILVFNNPDITDDSGWDGCPWVDEVISPRTNDEAVW